MRKSVHSSNSKCVCKKIFGISVTCPVCRLAPTSQVTLQEKLKPKAGMTTPTKAAAELSNARANSKADEKQKRLKLDTKLTKEGRTASLQGYNDAFSDYIASAKIRIRAMSNVGIEKMVSRSADTDVLDTKKEDGPKDAFSVYINRAKMKIRKTSSIGSRKIVSFKREQGKEKN